MRSMVERHRRGHPPSRDALLANGDNPRNGDGNLFKNHLCRNP